VAFLRGSSRERQIINAAFDRVYAHAGNIFRKQAVVSSAFAFTLPTHQPARAPRS
jgi:hypothetical protein